MKRLTFIKVDYEYEIKLHFQSLFRFVIVISGNDLYQVIKILTK